MKLGKIIYTHRKEKNMTQEQLAEKLGVSVPAVSKWETNVSLPDITLLAPIARLFEISIDELLSFNSELTEEEINQIMKELRKIAEECGLSEGMAYAEQMFRQYPNSEKLRLEAAIKLSAVSHVTALNSGSPETAQTCREKIVKIWEDLMNSDDFYISNAAKTSTASHYMSCGRLDEAEIIFEQMKLPEEWNSQRILPTVYLMKQEYEKAFEASEQNLQADWDNMIIDLRTIYNIVLQEQDYDRALVIANTVCTISGSLGNWLNNGLDMLLEVYLKKSDIPNSLPAFENYIDKLIDSNTSPGARAGFPAFFKEINERRNAEAVTKKVDTSGVNILQIMYQSIAGDKKYDIIRSTDIYKQSMKKLERESVRQLEK